MATPLATILQWWKRYAKPTAEQIAETFRSFRHKNDKIPAADVEGMDNLLLQKVDKIPFEAHRDDTVKHITALERESWDAKMDRATFDQHANNEGIHVTPSEKANFANKKLIIADENGIPQFELDLPSVLRLKGGVFDSSLKQWEVSPLAPYTVYLSSTGNDATAAPNNAQKPYKTLDAVVAYLATTASKGVGWNIITLNNGVFSLTTNNNSLEGFNIVNNSGATILIQNFISNILKELKFYFSNGILNFQFTDNTVTTGDSFFNTNIKLYQNVENVIFSNISSGSATDVYGKLRRGVFRKFGTIEFFRWKNLKIEDDTFSLSDDNNYTNDINIDNIDSYEATSNYGASPLLNFAASNTSYFINIGTYYNRTNKIHSLRANKLSVNEIISPNALTFIEYNLFEQRKDCVFQNTSISRDRIAPSIKKMIWQGNNFETVFNHTISQDIVKHIGFSVKSPALGYDYSTGMFFNNFNFKVPSTSLTRFFIENDLRSGRNGLQIVLNNGVFNCEKTMQLFAFKNYVNTGVDYQIVFRNTIRIKNNTHLVFGNVPAGVPPTVLVQENASITHDFGQIHSNANFQNVITDVKTY